MNLVIALHLGRGCPIRFSQIMETQISHVTTYDLAHARATSYFEIILVFAVMDILVTKYML